MMRMIGAADEFWRVRLTRVDTTDNLDFEWHEDILYRQPRVTPADEIEFWNVEAVRLDDYDAVVRIAAFGDRDDAQAFVDRVKIDLTEMTKSQFEDAYLTPSPVAEEPPLDDTL